MYNVGWIYTGEKRVIRVQIYLDEGADRWLEERASVQGTTKSALIRESIQLLQAQWRSDEEHMLKLIGLAGPDPEGATDVAEHHDKYLIEAELERWRRPS